MQCSMFYRSPNDQTLLLFQLKMTHSVQRTTISLPFTDLVDFVRFDQFHKTMRWPHTTYIYAYKYCLFGEEATKKQTDR